MTHASLFSGISGFDECEKISLRVRQESVKAYGNAIVPQVAYEIFKAIELCR